MNTDFNTLNKENHPINNKSSINFGTTPLKLKIEHLSVQMPKRDSFGNTPLMKAILGKNPQKVKVLTREAKGIDKVNHQNETALLLAVKKNCLYSVKRCLKLNANTNICDDKNRTPLAYASAIGSMEMVQALIEAKSHLNTRDINFLSPLMRAIIRNNYEIVKELLFSGADPNLPDNNGVTPLMKAAIRSSLPIVKLLLNLGADLETTDHSHRSVLDIIKMMRPPQYQEIKKIIQDKNSFLKIQTKEFLNRKKLAHFWHFGGTTTLISKDGLTPIKKNLIGGRTSLWVHQIRKNFIEFQKLYPKALCPSLANALYNALKFTDENNYCNTSVLLEKIKATPFTLLPGGTKDHAMLVVFTKNKLAICNRGAASNRPIEIFHYDPQLLTEELLRKIQYRYPSYADYKNFFFNDLVNKLSLSQTRLDQQLQNLLPLKNQILGNCSLVSLITAIFAAMQIETEDPNSEICQNKINGYKTWLYFELIRSLEEIVKPLENKDYPFEPDCMLIDSVLCKAFMLPLDAIQSEKLHKLIKTYSSSLSLNQQYQLQEKINFWQTRLIHTSHREFIINQLL